ncbi:ABC transporter permease [Paraglaciecola agarilytica]|jgi:putative ABC transport system permease protein|uniref:ABC transporter permease n=1 Tax=Paraglaciecola chathamensis TaxID=368405 RepID=UPI001C08DFAA|nr:MULTISPECIES: ABC transporter permease [Paraglaciecola]MBU3018813.1 ABC transporter permease [Paraglaciecola agarilytica]MDO6559948.1 ABC transporter permease [Paraglaciecola chathamensis]
MLISLAWSSLCSRKKSVILTFLSLLISISVLLSVEHIRQQAKTSFNRTISGADLIVGAPSGQLNLLLYSVFRMGDPTSNIEYKSYEMLKNNQQVAWAIPISLGDSHRGFRVLGTNSDYFAHYQYGDNKPIEVASGKPFSGMFDTVIGADVAKALNYSVGDKIIIAHGIGATSFSHHDHSPFVISGILKPTGTPVDKTVHVTLQAIEAIHLPPSQLDAILEGGLADKVKPDSVTAVILGLKTKFATFKLQRDLNNYQGDRLMAVLPGVALAELWQMMASIENVLRVISVLVLISSLFGLSTMLLASMNERKGEIAVLRTLGAGPSVIFALILLEALMLVLLAIASAIVLVSATLALFSDGLSAHYGLFLSANLLSWETLQIAILITVASIITSALPAFEAYKKALQSSLSS